MAFQIASSMKKVGQPIPDQIATIAQRRYELRNQRKMSQNSANIKRSSTIQFSQKKQNRLIDLNKLAGFSNSIESEEIKERTQSPKPRAVQMYVDSDSQRSAEKTHESGVSKKVGAIKK